MPRFFLVFISIVFASSAKAEVWTFETPSQNIQCVVGQEPGISDLACTIIERSGRPAFPKPADCTSDWGHDFFMTNTGAVRMLCQPLSRARDGFDRADYGVTGRFGGFVCHSSKKGLECKNEVGHGFFLSRSVQKVF